MASDLDVYFCLFTVILDNSIRSLSERKVYLMDKSKVISAYRRGFITFRECGQILGVEDVQLKRLVQLEENRLAFPQSGQRIGS